MSKRVKERQKSESFTKYIALHYQFHSHSISQLFNVFVEVMGFLTYITASKLQCFAKLANQLVNLGINLQPKIAQDNLKV